MSKESLEDGEIDSESERSPDPASPGDFNNEDLIDEIVLKENETARKSKTNSSTTLSVVEKQKNNRTARRASLRRQESSRNMANVKNMTTSWHANGNSDTGSGEGHEIRPAPPDSVIFGIPAIIPQKSQFLTTHYDRYVKIIGDERNYSVPNQDITRLQNLVNHIDYYPQHMEFPPPPPPPHSSSFPRQPLHYFNSPPGPPLPLMSLAFQQRPPLFTNQMSQPQMLFQPISPTPINVPYRGDNYEEVSMEVVSPDEPQYIVNDPFVKPPIQIPLEAVRTFTPKATDPVPAPPPVASTAIAHTEDEAALREMLLSQLKQKKKRSAVNDNEEATKTKRTRNNSATAKLSESVQNIFGAKKPLQKPPPAPRIEVKLGSTASSKTPESPVIQEFSTSAVIQNGIPIPSSKPDIVASSSHVALSAISSPTPLKTVLQEPLLTRDQKRSQLLEKMRQIKLEFCKEREKVQSASIQGKEAVSMAKEAAELAKKAEEMNKRAMELRKTCKEQLMSGKDHMKKLLSEKQNIQKEIDLMSIEDMEDIDDEEFPEICITSVKIGMFCPSKMPKEEPAFVSHNCSFTDSKTTDNSFQQLPINRIEESVEEHNDQNEQQWKENDLENDGTKSKDITDNKNSNEEDKEEMEGEDEYEEVEVEEDGSSVMNVTNANQPPLPSTSSEVSANYEEVTSGNSVATSALDTEQALRARLLNKFVRTGPSPDGVVPVVSSSMPDRVEDSRNVLIKMCKFELNGKCERPKICSFLHLRDIKEYQQQSQLLEGLFREVFDYNECDIDTAVVQTLHFMPEFKEFERLMDQFFKMVIHNTPDYKNRLFTFFANRR